MNVFNAKGKMREEEDEGEEEDRKTEDNKTKNIWTLHLGVRE